MGDVVTLGDGSSGAEEFDTRDSHLAAALMAIGIAPCGAEPVTVVTFADRPGESFQFTLSGVSACGRYKTRDMLAAWREGEAWIDRHPEHPFAYAMACAKNYAAILRYIKRAERQVWLQRGRSIAMLPLNASAELEARILGRFGK